MAEGGVDPNQKPNLDFQVTYEGIGIIRDQVLLDPTALDRWQQVKYDLVTIPASRTQIDQCKTMNEQICKTLECWISEKSTHATLKSFIDTVRMVPLQLTSLADAVEQRAAKIYAAQNQVSWTHSDSTSAGASGGICFGMTQLALNVQTRRKELDDLHIKILDSESKSTSTGWTVITNIHGLGGVGKTTLAKLYVYEKCQEFEGNVLWINGSSVASMKHSFINLVRHVRTVRQLTPSGASACDDLSNRDLATTVYNIFRTEKSLFIFDDVENFEDFHQFRPCLLPGAAAAADHRPYILVTSRISAKPAASDNIQRLDVFSEQDASEFIRDNLQQLPPDSDCATRLADKLGRLPLALQQAISVINESYDWDQPQAVESFLQDYETATKELLENDIFHNYDHSYQRTVYTTFTLALQKIKEQEAGEFAIKLLEYVSFMKNEGVEVKFLKKLVKRSIKLTKWLRNVKSADDVPHSSWSWSWSLYRKRIGRPKPTSKTDENLTKGLRLLMKFSLIHVSSNDIKTIEIHRLVQDVVRLNLKPKVETEILREMMMFLERALEKPELKTQALVHSPIVAQFAQTKLLNQFKSLNLKISKNHTKFEKIKAQLLEASEHDITILMQALVHDDKIALAVLFMNGSKLSVTEYLKIRQHIEHQKPVKEKSKLFLLNWIKNRLELVYEKPNLDRNLTSYMVKFFPHLDTQISLPYFAKLLGDNYSVEQIEPVLKELQAQCLLKYNSISLDPVAKYAFSLVGEDSSETPGELRIQCVEFVNQCLLDDEKCSDELKNEAARHGFAVLKQYFRSDELKAKFPLFPLQVCIRTANELLNERVNDEGVLRGREFGFLIGNVLDELADRPELRTMKSGLLWIQLEQLQDQLYCDVKTSCDVSTQIDFDTQTSAEQARPREVTRALSMTEPESMELGFKELTQEKSEKSVFRKWIPKLRYPNLTIPHIPVFPLTSRMSDLAPLPQNQLKLDVLRPDESIELILSLLPESPKDVAEQLANRLQHFPLALQQAVAYIRDTYIHDEEAIPRYLKEFDEREKELLDDDKFKELLNTEYWTTFTVWSATLARMEKLKDGPAAILLINKLAYLKPDSISIDFCREVLEAEVALKTLARFSMVHVLNPKVLIHRLVQDVIRLRLSSEEEVDALLNVISTIKRQLDKKEPSNPYRECVQHGVHLFQFQIKHQRTMHEDMFLYIEQLYISVVLCGNRLEALSISQQAASYYEGMNGKEHESTLRMKRIMASSYYDLHNYTESMTILKSILPTSNSKLGPNHSLTLDILSSIARNYTEMKDYASAIEILDELIQKNSSQPENKSSLAHNYDKAYALKSLGRVDEALELFEDIHRNSADLCGQNYPFTLAAEKGIGEMYLEKGEIEKALEIFNKVKMGYTTIFGESHPYTIQVKKIIEIASFKLEERHLRLTATN